MASFVENLWSAVFTPGPTPTLLVATNVTFAALQFLLLALLIATYSIHFVILSVLCGGLWWSVNWFASELQAAQLKEEEAERLRKQKKDIDRKEGGESAGSGADDEAGEDTETEERTRVTTPDVKGHETTSETQRIREDVIDAVKVSGRGGKNGGGSAASGVQAGERLGTKQRNVQAGDRSGDISSTDSEWEKVEDER
ncbi:hypothetical protein KC318_g4042 [Hortaea werneckii]|uniref:Uncharacterized protein n=1 Tax=Hortaea werneckii TaxID=91943 RepID=A0A3M7BBA9_HORWE|nr:hypothetical protein KC334_g6596 [Hortaea werneckii]KAI7017688.1 hypothetical protein KC355_g3597 [Hortaea werneckii]KAI7670448.1 hypothetical protein KC318_g4042 [Hortaea werneckii]RMY06600.1 hypothetical protein D0867_09634 [Hortaea werneckii]RMY36954.1 hypothetical protein D0866_03580 [Hortaea werneckii]